MIRGRVPAAPATFAMAAVAWAATGSWMAPTAATITVAAVAVLVERASLRGVRDVTSAGHDAAQRGRTGSLVGEQMTTLMCLGIGSCAILARMQYDGVAVELTAFATGSAIGVGLCVFLDALPRSFAGSAPHRGDATAVDIAAITALGAATAVAAAWTGRWEPVASTLGLALLLGVHASSRLTAGAPAEPEPERGVSR
ncbi:hypothetical protein BJ980_000769 [Nocardioides daedukensis]|uniref:Uncharacterized protein n=1 Tax=Nocardioides daedukensis TaxID=634462 RepID=A0A7Y9RWA8_9ACTN|nr:hypothetical protein [Nocardioides daedukensis]NYG57846.1 hypothetical protein [Nocardioides daedukensis]